MYMSPRTRKILNLASSLLHAVLDAAVFQAILSSVLSLTSSVLAFEVRVFFTGIIIVGFSAGSLYGFESLRRSLKAERRAYIRSVMLIAVLCVLFAFTSEAEMSLSAVVLSLAGFFAVNVFIRLSLRHVVASDPKKFFRFLTAKAAYADEGPSGEIDTSLRKDYRYNMKAVLAKKSRIYLFLKRAFDVVASGCALLVLSPVFLITAIAIKLEDGGPVLYSARRWGKDMQVFRMRKFRSMKVNADDLLKNLLKDSEMTGHAFKIKNDPRITKVGHFIRKYSIDELPQLWNIFVGDMSIVGPRPIMTVDTDTIDGYDKQRWIIRPGLTCYWQVSGRANIKWAQWVEMDLDYIENMSLSEDIKLILKTIPVVFKADGAY